MKEKNLMSVDEYIEKVRELGYSEESIKETIRLREKEKRELGKSVPYEYFLIELPKR